MNKYIYYKRTVILSIIVIILMNLLFVFHDIKIFYLISIGLFMIVGIIVADIYFINIRMHIAKLNKQIIATNSAISLLRIPVKTPIYFMGHTVAPDFVQIVNEIIRRNTIESILELGSGLSTILLSAFIKENGLKCDILSLENSEDWVRLIKNEVDKNINGYTNINIEVVYAPLKKYSNLKDEYYTIESIPKDKKYDLIVIDGPSKAVQRQYSFQMLNKFIKTKTIFIFDDGDLKPIPQSIKKWIKVNSDWEARYYQTVKGTWVIKNKSIRSHLPLP
jgi:predicted O-methyltransferase YrrM